MAIEQSESEVASRCHQRRIGLTGGIASGKSSVGRLLSDHHGYPVLDADGFARDALAPGSAAARAVADRYGPAVVQRPGATDKGVSLDRAALGHIVFNDARERLWLEELVHPIVRARFAEALNDLNEQPVVVLMIPLLFEASLEGLCSEVWLVDCDEEQQRARLMARDGLSDSDARVRIAAQWPLAHKRQLATVVLDNRGTPEALTAQVKAALHA